MGTLNSIGLWGALAAIGIAVPVVIHLLYRKHRKQTDWAAMELLRRALVVRSGQVKLEDSLVLVLRCLALLLLALALLRPTLDSGSSGWLGEKRVGMVIALDASFSMNHGDPSRFERAIETAREIVGTAREGDPLSVVLMSNCPEVLVRGADYDPGQVAAVLDAQPAATPYRLSLARNLELLDELVDELKTPGKECYLLTDAQEIDWAELPDPARAALTRLAGKAKVFVIPTGSDREENLALDRLAFSSGTLRPGHVANFTAQVRNDGRQTADGGTVEFFLNDRLRRRQAIGSIKPGERREVFFNTTLEAAGPLRVRAQLSVDELVDDNVRHAIVQVQRNLQVLAVGPPGSGDPQAGPNATYFAATALRPRDLGVESDVQVNRIESPDLSLEQLADFDLVILADVPAPAPEVAARLRAFVQRGGGLLVFAGPHVDPAHYAQRFGTGPDGLLPATLGPALKFGDKGEGDRTGWSLAPAQSQHLLAGMVSRLPELMIDEPRFRTVLRADPAPGSEILLTIPELGAPLLLSRRRGSGSVVLCTTSADLTWSDFPQCGLYVALLNQIVTNLTNDPDALQLTAGETVALPVPGREAGQFVSLTDPSGQSRDLRVSRSAGQPVAVIDFEATGIYEIAGDRRTEREAVVVASNPAPRESRIRVLDRTALGAQLDPLGVTVLAGDGKLAAEVTRHRRGRELAHLLLLLAILVFVLQSILARHFTNKMSREEKPGLAATLQRSQVAAARRS